jgi:hypothetical protein
MTQFEMVACFWIDPENESRAEWAAEFVAPLYEDLGNGREMKKLKRDGQLLLGFVDLNSE